MMFRFRKLYADVVAGDGSVTVVYLTWLEALGARLAWAGVERYGPDGRRAVYHARPPGWDFDPDAVRHGWHVRLELLDGACELHYSGMLPPWHPAGPPPHDAIEWRVLIPRATVTGRWTGGGADATMTGIGYCDWVELRRPPRLLGMRRLCWGRAHLASETVVFSALRFGSGRTWSRAARWHGRTAPRDPGVSVVSDGTGGVEILMTDAAPVALISARLLHDGSGLDRQRFPSVPVRLLARALTGAMHERRWLAVPARLGDTGSGWAVHEVVSFA